MSFVSDIRRFVVRTRAAQNTIVRAATIELFSSVVLTTPVDTGRARGAWSASVGAPLLRDNGRLDKGGSQAVAEIMQKTPAGAGQETFLSNPLPYIERLENGWSKKAPDGMVRISMDRVSLIVDAAVRANRV